MQHDNIDLPISNEAKDAAAQIKCWFSTRGLNRSTILAKHYICGLLVNHMLDDFHVVMFEFPQLCDFPSAFSYDTWTVEARRMAYCVSSSRLFDNPRMIMIADVHEARHWHRLCFTLTGAPDHALSTDVDPEWVSLNLLLKIPRPHVICNKVNEYNEVDGGLRANCPLLVRRRRSFNQCLFTAVSRLCGKFQKVRSRYWKRVPGMYAPGSEAFYDLMKKYKITPATRWRFLRYLGLNDVVRANRWKFRVQRLRFLVGGRKK